MGIILLYLVPFIGVAAMGFGAFLSGRLKRLPIIVLSTALILIGCGGGGSVGTAPTPTPTPTPTPASAYVPLSETIIVGDEIVQGWPLAKTAAADCAVNYLGTIQNVQGQCTMASKCISGCSPNQVQLAVENGAKRVVLLMGTKDISMSSACFGGAGAVWDGKPGDIGDPIQDYMAEIDGAIHLYSLSVYVGTIPPIYVPSVSAPCSAAVTAWNQELAEQAKANGAMVVDFNSVLQTSADFTSGGYVPNASGYTAMTTAYNAANQ